MNQTKFMHSGTSVDVISINPDTTFDDLKPNIYDLRYNDMRGFYLEVTSPSFQTPELIFGGSEKRAEKVLNTYKDRDNSTGILLTGDKGSGKTLLTQLVCNKMLAEGIPVINITSKFVGPAFNKIITDIGECVIVVDEFAKVYSKTDGEDPQNHLLSLMDGVGSDKRLIILTENKENLVNEFMINRTGRIYYHWRYAKLDDQTIKDFCSHFSIEEDVTTSIVELSRYCNEFSFDILKAIVEEYHRYGETVDQILEDLNIEFSQGGKESFRVEKVVDSSTNKEMILKGGTQVTKFPAGRHNHEFIAIYCSDKELKEKDETCISFCAQELKYSGEGRYVYQNDEGYLIIGVKEVNSALDDNFVKRFLV